MQKTVRIMVVAGAWMPDDLNDREIAAVEAMTGQHFGNLPNIDMACTSGIPRATQTTEIVLATVDSRIPIETVPGFGFTDIVNRDIHPAPQHLAGLPREEVTVQEWLNEWPPCNVLRRRLEATLIETAWRASLKREKPEIYVLAGGHAISAVLAAGPTTTTPNEWDVITYTVQVNPSGCCHLIASDLQRTDFAAAAA